MAQRRGENLMKKNPKDEKLMIDTAKVRDLLGYIVRGIAPYAEAARLHSVTDREVDMFTAELLAASGSMNPLQMKTVERFAFKAKEIQDRAKTLYEQAARDSGRSPKSFAQVPKLDCLSDDILKTAAQIRQEREQCFADYKIRSWYELCESKMRAFAAIITTSMTLNTTDYDAYGFIHKIMSGLTAERSLFELAALSQYIEKETMRLVNLAVAGDTLVDLPAKVTPVKVSRVVMVESGIKPCVRVTGDRV